MYKNYKNGLRNAMLVFAESLIDNVYRKFFSVCRIRIQGKTGIASM